MLLSGYVRLWQQSRDYQVKTQGHQGIRCAGQDWAKETVSLEAVLSSFMLMKLLSVFPLSKNMTNSKVFIHHLLSSSFIWKNSNIIHRNPLRIKYHSTEKAIKPCRKSFHVSSIKFSILFVGKFLPKWGRNVRGMSSTVMVTWPPANMAQHIIGCIVYIIWYIVPYLMEMLPLHCILLSYESRVIIL